jgi:hypothetical protein
VSAADKPHRGIAGDHLPAQPWHGIAFRFHKFDSEIIQLRCGLCGVTTMDIHMPATARQDLLDEVMQKFRAEHQHEPSQVGSPQDEKLPRPCKGDLHQNVKIIVDASIWPSAGIKPGVYATCLDCNETYRLEPTPLGLTPLRSGPAEARP